MTEEQHDTSVIDKGGRYPYQPTCTCGWKTWGYIARWVAELMVEDHEKEVAKCLAP